MAFTFTNYAGIQPQRSPLHNLIGDILGGYTDTTKAQFLRPTLQEQLQKAQLENQWYGPNMQSQIGLRGAQAGHLGAMTEGLNISNPFLKQQLIDAQQKRQFEMQNPLLSHTGAAGQIGALMYLQQHPELMQSMEQQGNQPQEIPNIGEGQSYIPSLMQQTQQHTSNPMELLQQSILSSLNPKQKQFAPSNIGKLHQELNDIEAGFYPNSNRSLTIESEQKKEDLAAPYREKIGGLKTGEHYIYDPESHEKIGIEKPLSEKERGVETGRAFFNEIYPDINNAFKDFIGKNSINNFTKYADEYGKNEVATRKIDDLLLGQKLISAGVVNEAATLGAGKTNQTYKNLASSFPGSDIPKLIEQYSKQLKLPTEAFVKAGIRFQDKINQASEKSINSVPATRKVYFQPEKHLKEEKKTEKSNKSVKHYTDSDIRATAEKYGISEEEVKKQLKKAKKNG